MLWRQVAVKPHETPVRHNGQDSLQRMFMSLNATVGVEVLPHSCHFAIFLVLYSCFQLRGVYLCAVLGRFVTAVAILAQYVHLETEDFQVLALLFLPSCLSQVLLVFGIALSRQPIENQSITFHRYYYHRFYVRRVNKLRASEPSIVGS